MNIIKPDHEHYPLLRYRTSLVGFYKNHPVVQYTDSTGKQVYSTGKQEPSTDDQGKQMSSTDDLGYLNGFWIIDQEVYIRIEQRETSNGWEWGLVSEEEETQ